MKLQATTLNGQMMLRAVNPYEQYRTFPSGEPSYVNPFWQAFEANVKHYPADIPGLKDDDILDSEDCDLVWQIYHQGREIWLDINHDSFRDLTPLGYKTRQAYILKSQPKLSDRIGHINCDPEALKDPEFVNAINQMAELAYLKGKSLSSINEEYVCCGAITNPETGKHERGGKEHDLCGWSCQPFLNERKEEEVISDIFSHIMEGAKKSPFVQAAKIIDEYVNGCCMDVPRRIGQDILKELYDQGYTITKQP